MEQQRALNALEPYLALSKSATSPRAAADLISQATSAPNTYVFAELLETPNIQALQSSSDYGSHLQLLQIFAWGTLHDYTSNPSLPKLNDAQHQKLQLLTLLPLLATPSQDPSIDPLSYTYLQKALALPSNAALESLVQTALYASLLQGHLDPVHQRVVVNAIAPLRDLAPGSIQPHLQVLSDWDDRCTSVLQEIAANIQGIKQNSALKAQAQRRRDEIFEEELAKSDKKKNDRDAWMGDAMDVDDGGRGAVRGVKRTLPGFFKGS